MSSSTINATRRKPQPIYATGTRSDRWLLALAIAVAMISVVAALVVARA